MFGGKAKIPLVIRTTIGGGKGYAGQHSQSLEAVATMFPGLKVIAPSTALPVLTQSPKKALCTSRSTPTTGNES